MLPVGEQSKFAHSCWFEHFSVKEAGDIAIAYVAHAELTKNAPDDRTIVLDTILCDALFKGVSELRCRACW
jgi:hypothetical protein